MTIAGEAKTEVSCLYGCGHSALPGIETYERDVCNTVAVPLVKAPLTSGKCTGSDHVAQGNCAMYGASSSGGYESSNEFTPQGARFDGSGDFIEIPSINYGDDATFTISFWFTKGNGEGQPLTGSGCTGNLYEYLYSHNERASASISDYEGASNSNVNIYMGCDQAAQAGTNHDDHTAGYATCGHESTYHTPPGTVLRINLMDSGSEYSRRSYIPDGQETRLFAPSTQ